jgi:tartrate-resistant acid phosphatase type 5
MSSSRAICEALESRQLLATNGLSAVYFNNASFTGSTSSRIDGSVSIALPSLHSRPAGTKIDGKTFSARWHGLVKPYSSETYTFITKNTDGVRLWVNGKLIIDSWKPQPTRTHAGTIALKKNRLYDLRLEYYNGRHAAKMLLAWDTPSRAAAVVPASRLFAYDTRSASIGDYGWDNDNEAAVASMMRTWKPQFITTVGDNNYTHGSASTIDPSIGQYFFDFIGNYKGDYGSGPSSGNYFFPALGNHDWDTSGAQPYRNYFTLPGNERYYDIVKGPIHFFFVDSDPREPDGNTAGSKQGQWLRGKLAASNSPFNVVILHHSPYSSGSEGESEWMQWPFKDWGADLVLSGHSHAYERLSIGGLAYVVNGAGGDPLPFQETVSGSLVRKTGIAGALLIEANEFAMTLQYQTIDGRVVDTMTMGP